MAQGTKISQYSVIDTLTGAEKIPLGVGVKKATTPDQLAGYIRPQRKSLSVDAGFVSNNQVATGRFAIEKGYLLRVLAMNVRMRIRLYPTAALRDDDLARPINEDYVQGSAQFLEFNSSLGKLDVVLSPAINGFTLDGYTYYSVQNLSLTDATLIFDFDYLVSEV